MEKKVQKALEYLKEYPSAKIATVAKAFGITRAVLRNRLAGRGGLNRKPSPKLKLSPIDEQAICNYIDRLDRTNLAVRPEFICEAANSILKAKAHPSNQKPPTVGKSWVRRFTKRHHYLRIRQKRGLLAIPHPPLPQPASSPLQQTPVTVRHVNKAAAHILDALIDTDDIDPELAIAMGRFIKGSILNATELLQTKIDLSRTKLAEQTARSRRATKNTPLKSGGVLTVAGGREIVRQKAITDETRARRLIEQADLRYKKATKRAFEEAAKVARHWRLIGRLQPALIADGNGRSRLLRRF
ncbi:hypothetical protein CIB48_g9710 [Xylaria polymorpha]|nr:hypothetical protein CIB48_g9710 [Xylaria polymorpha]